MNRLLIILAAAASLLTSACRDTFDEDLRPANAADHEVAYQADPNPPRAGDDDQRIAPEYTETGAIRPETRRDNGAVEQPLKFSISMSPCIRQGITAVVSFAYGPDNEIYDVSWYVDGTFVERGLQVNCVCGDEVTAEVVRRSDGASGRVTERLLPCEDQ